MAQLAATVSQHILSAEESMNAFSAVHTTKLTDIRAVVEATSEAQVSSLAKAKGQMNDMAAARKNAVEESVKRLQQQMGVMLQTFAAEQTAALATSVDESAKAMDQCSGMSAELNSKTGGMIVAATEELARHTEATIAANAAHTSSVASLVAETEVAGAASKDRLATKFDAAAAKMDEVAAVMEQQSATSCSALDANQNIATTFVTGHKAAMAAMATSRDEHAASVTAMAKDAKSAVDQAAAVWQTQAAAAVDSLNGATGALSQKVGGIGDRLSAFKTQVRAQISLLAFVC